MRPRQVLIPIVALNILLAPALADPVAGAAAPRWDSATARNDRVTPDNRAGSYRRLDGVVDAAHATCSTNRRAQAEAAVAIHPLDPNVIAVSAMDACQGTRSPLPIAQPQHELSLFRSRDGGATWQASLVPGYLGDVGRDALEHDLGCLPQADATLSFDRQGRLFYGTLCPVLPGNEAAGRVVPVDFRIVVLVFSAVGALERTVRVDVPASQLDEERLASDKPNLVVDQTGGPHDGNVYVSWTTCPRVVPDRTPEWIAPCVGPSSTLHVARSADHGRTFEAPLTIGPATLRRPHFSDLAVGPDGSVDVVFRTSADASGKRGVWLARSPDGGATFGDAHLVAHFDAWGTARYAGEPPLVPGLSGNSNGGEPCGDGPWACPTGFTLPPLSMTTAVAADVSGVHVVWGGATREGQGRVYVRSSPDGLTWPAPAHPIVPRRTGHQWLPDAAAAGGVVSVVFLDSRHDRAYSANLPPGDRSDRTSSGPAVDAYVAQSSDGGRTWQDHRLSSRSFAPGLETYLDARAPWLGDYLYVAATPAGAYAVWTDTRDVVLGADNRAGNAHDGFDVHAPCAWAPNSVDGPPTGYALPLADDACLRQGGLDTNVYGARLPRRRAGMPAPDHQ